MSAKVVSSRACAANILYEVIYRGKSLSPLLNVIDDAFVKDVCFGCLRWHFQLSELISIFVKKPLRTKDKDVECLLRVGLYQLMYQQTPSHAAVNETVNALKTLKKPWAKQLINGVLRNYLRHADSSQNNGLVFQSLEAKNHLPDWLYKRFVRDWPDNADAITEASVQRAPMTLRVNLSRSRRKAYLQRLLEAGIPAVAHEFVASAIILDQAVTVSQLPGFKDGCVSVQDAAAQLAAFLLDPTPNTRVLDACAAPGGKTGHLLEYADGLDLLALDCSEERLMRVDENLSRLQVSATTRAMDVLEFVAQYHDATNTGENSVGHGLFDTILLDAPCSGSGVIRRHPDIKLLRKPADIDNLSRTQMELLSALWSVLKPGGRLLYATCSILSVENEAVINAFLALTPDASCETIDVEALQPFAKRVAFGLQVLPGEAGMDGFYYAKLVKMV